MRFTFGDLGFNIHVQLAQAYRSLSRPSSKFKPSYPSNSLIESIFLHFDLIKSFTSVPKDRSVFSEFLILFSSNINPVARAFSNSPSQRG